MTEVWQEYRDRIAGGWRIIAVEHRDPSTDTVVAKPQLTGRVYISPHGWLSALIASPVATLPLPSGQQFRSASDAEVARIARGFQAYCGYMKLFKDEQGRLYWQTSSEMGSDLNMLGGIQERTVLLSTENGKEYMTLLPKTLTVAADGSTVQSVIKWERFEQAARPSL
ncbi:hypothetical protein CERZMDRAFT_113803 [Cercospora zeae-maydis SCOH1-5]|uniref:Lipocalin-like domain-containing protein n=1 Tax=Cercospora zeae-maydis SCOH1-5 TaxID=717836 RepID=A0A6A6F7N3_9PEZI|nr:hypothetical protein CERZMDRAFT_113803 [Cercospora zeae-maydis SCOH1-5]